MKKRLGYLMIIGSIAALAATAGCGGSGAADSSAAPVSAEGAVSGAETAAGAIGESGAAGEETAVQETTSETVQVKDYTERAVVTEDRLTWEYNDSTATIRIRGTGPMKDYGGSLFAEHDYEGDYPPWIEYKDKAQHVIVDEGITGIGKCAFLNFTALESTELPKSLDYVGEASFYYCEKLNNVNMPHVRILEKDCFAVSSIGGNTGRIVIPEGCEYIDQYAFADIDSRVSVVFPSTLKDMAPSAFLNYPISAYDVAEGNERYMSKDGILYSRDGKTIYRVPNLNGKTGYEIPEGVETLAPVSFKNLTEITRIRIPSSVKEMSEAFGGNHKLESFELAENNPLFKAVDGVLFTKDGKEMISYPQAKNDEIYSIPAGTEHLKPGAIHLSPFRVIYFPSSYIGPQEIEPVPGIYAGELKEAHYAEGIKVIGPQSMAYCEGLETLYFPNSLKKIGKQAFITAAGLKDIYYEGTEAEWKAVEIEEGNEFLTQATVHFSK
ncbi:leucine-rich repeat domain-containing protein [[Clostridium] aminophilum]|uniref:Leucine rich repeat-containing protein n=1 Tax=[Clostridium] aminophilum TaxID=1526 RepID=A0A1I6IAA9_9FIRM|nr:leucine-rich repeat domain-containing protein [[Clostridium] aminophilum]SFR63626.1 Leucine rich repeat-containing protein [[Clostridium] aminophilum]